MCKRKFVELYSFLVLGTCAYMYKKSRDIVTVLFLILQSFIEYSMMFYRTTCMIFGLTLAFKRLPRFKFDRKTPRIHEQGTTFIRPSYKSYRSHVCLAISMPDSTAIHTNIARLSCDRQYEYCVIFSTTRYKHRTARKITDGQLQVSDINIM